MDPLTALSGEPRKPGAQETAAPDAAHWLTNPTTQTKDNPLPASIHDRIALLENNESETEQMQILLSLGKDLADEDAEKWQRNKK